MNLLGVDQFRNLNTFHPNREYVKHKTSFWEKISIAYINLLSFGAFFIIVASIIVRQLFLQEIWKYIDLNSGGTRWQIITIVSRVKLNRVLYMRATS